MPLKLECINEQNVVILPENMEQKLEELLSIAARMESIDSGEVTVTFVDDESIQDLNREYRNLDKPTDVLSFSMWEESESELKINYDGDERPGEDPIGDIVISLPTAKRQSEEYGHSLEREIGFLFVHGFLHLIGYDHQDEQSERIMMEKQELVLQEAGLFR